MSKRHFCQACWNEEYGVKTRLPVPHTCGKGPSGVTTLRTELAAAREKLLDALELNIIAFEDDWSRNPQEALKHFRTLINTKK